MIKKYLSILLSYSLIFFISCSENDNKSEEIIEIVEPFEFSNATNLDQENQIEIVTWNIKRFPQDKKYSVPYVQSLLELWNADIYLFQEILDIYSLMKMVDQMDAYSYILSDEAAFALVYKSNNVTFNSKNELWANTSSRNDGDSDYNNNAQYQFAGRPPMENYLTWSSNSKSIDLYIINVHYKCCGDGLYDINDPGDETTRRHHASLLLNDYIVNNRSGDNVIILGDFNNIGEQNYTNPAISPFIDTLVYASAKHFYMMDHDILAGPNNKYSWQGWTSSYSPAHFDHIIITQPLFKYIKNSIVGVIDTPMETGFSSTAVSNTISDHQPVFISFTID